VDYLDLKTDNVDSDHIAMLCNPVLLDFVIERATDTSRIDRPLKQYLVGWF
jgi:hypothetical protein